MEKQHITLLRIFPL